MIQSLRNTSLNIRLNILIVVVFSTLALTLYILQVSTTNQLVTNLGNEQMRRNAQVVLDNIRSQQQNISRDLFIYSQSAGFVNAVDENDVETIRTTLRNNVTGVRFDEIAYVPVDGERIDSADISDNQTVDNLLEQAFSNSQRTILVVERFSTNTDVNITTTDVSYRLKSVAITPIFDNRSNIIGALYVARDINSDVLDEINLQRTDSEIAVLVQGQEILRNSIDLNFNLPFQSDILRVAESGTFSINPELIFSEKGVPALEAYIPVPIMINGENAQAIILERTEYQTVYNFQQQFISQSIVVISIILIIAVITLVVFSRISITNPLNTIRLRAEQIANGNYDQRLSVTSDNEIGSLSQSFNSMAIAIQQRDEELTQNNAKLLESNRDLTISATIAHATATLLDEHELLDNLVTLTHEEFSLYHVSVFIFDSQSMKLKLTAIASPVAEQMLAENWAFALDNPVGTVPLAASRREVVLKNNVLGEDEHFDNPLLPETRSEISVPIIFQSELLGVINLQSTELNRFSERDLELYRLFADQIGVALHNAQLFDQVEVARSKAEQADKAKSAFLASTSHELRTPLNAIINLTSFVQRGMLGEVNERQAETLRLVRQSGQGLLTLINDVLDMSKIESGSLKLFLEDNVEVEPIIGESLATASSLLGDKPVELILKIEEAIPPITLDKHRCKQILLNLLSNACKFTEEGEIKLEVSTINDNLVVSVSDTGVGIAPQDLELVFEQFKQTETGLRQGGGTGLGMPITKTLVEAHGGRIWVESELHVGTTFTFTLPIVRNYESIEAIEGV